MWSAPAPLEGAAHEPQHNDFTHREHRDKHSGPNPPRGHGRTLGRCLGSRRRRRESLVVAGFEAYNFVRTHKTLRCSPAMAAGVVSTLWSTEDLVSAALDGVRP